MGWKAHLDAGYRACALKRPLDEACRAPVEKSEIIVSDPCGRYFFCSCGLGCWLLDVQTKWLLLFPCVTNNSFSVIKLRRLAFVFLWIAFHCGAFKSSVRTLRFEFVHEV